MTPRLFLRRQRWGLLLALLLAACGGQLGQRHDAHCADDPLDGRYGTV